MSLCFRRGADRGSPGWGVVVSAQRIPRALHFLGACARVIWWHSDLFCIHGRFENVPVPALARIGIIIYLPAVTVSRG